MRTNFLIKFIVLLTAIGFTQASLAAGSEPQQLVQNTANEVLNIIKSRQQEFRDNPSSMYAMVDEKVLPHFDFDRMTNLALGRYKRQINGEQRPKLVQEFRNVLVRTYGKALLEYNDQEILYLPMRGSLDKGEVTVRTEIQQKGGFPIPLNYELYLQDNNSWKVYDISVDNISLVTNYRASFAREIKANGIDGLIQVLQNRNKDEG